MFARPTEDKEDEGEIISEEEDDGDDDDDNNNVIAEGPIPSSGRSLKLIKTMELHPVYVAEVPPAEECHQPRLG